MLPFTIPNDTVVCFIGFGLVYLWLMEGFRVLVFYIFVNFRIFSRLNHVYDQWRIVVCILLEVSYGYFVFEHRDYPGFGLLSQKVSLLGFSKRFRTVNIRFFRFSMLSELLRVFLF